MQINFTNSSPELSYNLAVLRKIELSGKTKIKRYVSLQAVKTAQENTNQSYLYLIKFFSLSSQMHVMTILNTAITKAMFTVQKQ